MYSGVGGSTVLYAGDWPRPDAVRLPRALARRRRRRLAARPTRSWSRTTTASRARSASRASRAIRPTRRAPTRRCRRCRSGRGGWTWRARTTGSAGTGGRRRARSCRAPYDGPARVRALRHLHARAAPRAPRRPATSTHWPRGDRARRARGHRRARHASCCSAPAGRVDAAPSTSTRRARERAPRPTSWCWPPTRSARARLLLLSACAAFPDGPRQLARGLVGRRLMMHPFARRHGRLRRAARDLARQRRLAHPLAAVLRDRRAPRLRARRQVEPGAVDAAGRMNAAMPARAGRARVWGPEHHERVRERFGHCLSWGIFGEDLPDERQPRHARPRRSSTPPACPAPRVTYTRRRTTRGALLDFHVERARESLLAAGARERRHR